jgi:hypothetical protein
MEVHLGCVVEGDGEVQALPILVRVVAARIDPEVYVHIPTPVLVKRTRIDARFADFERAIEMAVAKIKAQGGILILLDSEGEPPCQLGPALQERARRARGDLPIAVVLAHRMFENWFLASAESLRGRRGLPADLQPPDQPETIHGAKDWLRQRMPPPVSTPSAPINRP